MNNTKTTLSNREQTRKDFSDDFLCDLAGQIAHGHDPRNWIGLSSGFSMGRALLIYNDRRDGYA